MPGTDKPPIGFTSARHCSMYRHRAEPEVALERRRVIVALLPAWARTDAQNG
jgi:hypothetical protein